MGNSDHTSPAEERKERFERLRSQWNQLSSRVTLGHLRDAIEDTTGQIDGLNRIAELSNRGYRFTDSLENRAAALREAWPARRREAINTLRDRASSLESLGKEIERLCGLSALSDRILDQLDHKLEHLQEQINAAERDVRGVYDSLSQQLSELERDLDEVEYLLDSLDTASFDRYPDENGVAATEAVWTNHPDEPKGILFLTDGRVIFEQREKKAKKKMLFITTESELVQQTMWESVIGNIAELEAEDKKKFLSHKELLHIGFREYSGGLHGDVTLRLERASNEEWAGLVRRVQHGDFAAPDRTESETASEAGPSQPPAEIPTRCPACGGQLPTLVKGMRELVCEYCGTITRI